MAVDPSKLAQNILDSVEARAAVEQAIMKGLQSFVETANAEIGKLVKANTLGPDVSAEMLALRKTVIAMTEDAVKNGPLGYVKAGGKT